MNDIRNNASFFARSSNLFKGTFPHSKHQVILETIKLSIIVALLIAINLVTKTIYTIINDKINKIIDESVERRMNQSIDDKIETAVDRGINMATGRKLDAVVDMRIDASVEKKIGDAVDKSIYTAVNKKIDSMSSVNKKKTPYTLIKPGTLNSHNLRKAPKTSLDSESSDKAPPKMYYALQNARRKGAIFNISKPKEISSVLYAIGSRYELKSESFSDIEEPKHWSPEDIVMCKCMDLTDLMMQQSISLKYTRSNKVKDSLVDDLEAKEVTLDKSIEHHSHVLVEAIKLHKSDIQGSMPAMNKDSFKVLLDIKESYENGTDLMLNKSCEYEREFIKNLNIVLYMISKEDLNNIDNEFMKKIHSHFSTHLSRNKFSFSSGNISFVKIDEETTEADVGEKFIKSFEEITREEE